MSRDEAQHVHTPPDAPEIQDAPHRSTWRMSRRRLLQTGATTGAIAGIETLTGVVHAQDGTPASATPDMMAHMAASAEPVDPLSKGLVHFSPPDAAIIEAASARLIPSDDTGPGAKEAGVVYFIDRQLARERRGYTGPIYEQGPFVPGTSTQGDQSALSTPDRFRLGIGGMDSYAQQLYSSRFVALSSDQQDRILSDMEKDTPAEFGDPSSTSFPPASLGSGSGGSSTAIGAAAFFSLLLKYVQAGFFADPIYGGNRDMVGWKMIGFPGAQMGYAELIDKHGEPFTGGYKSLADYQSELDGGE